MKGARAMNWAGFNLSIPHKVNVIPFLNGLGKSAAVMGAVNCAVSRGGKLIGENTDGKGFLQSLRKLIEPAGKTFMMLGRRCSPRHRRGACARRRQTDHDCKP